jgi:hypothetical protein
MSTPITLERKVKVEITDADGQAIHKGSEMIDSSDFQKKYDEALLKYWIKFSGGIPIIAPSYINEAAKRLREQEENEVKQKFIHKDNLKLGQF